VRLISRGGRDWGQHFPLIVAGALKLPLESFILDGEVVVLRPDGVSDFDALASRKHDKHALFYAFDMLAGAGEDLRSLPLGIRKLWPRADAFVRSRRNLSRRIRARRHRRGSVQGRLQYESRGYCLEASRSRLWRG
jgi:ATP-dependent DNA ligase